MPEPTQPPLPQPLQAHSMAEAHLYVMAAECPMCAKGPLVVELTKFLEERPATSVVAVQARCKPCDEPHVFGFEVPKASANADSSKPAIVNPTTDPSRIIDVGQWILLFRMITEAASRENNKMQARHLALEAAQCLEEALKFYEDNDVPPQSAFFCHVSTRRFREHPEQFSRQRLINLRAKLPSQAAMRAALDPTAKKRSWWRRWI